MKKYAAFLSFANPDRILVKTLSVLFKSIDLDVYFAPEDLPKRGSEAWRSAILEAIRSSHCIIPVLTPKSINRPWVLYEIGAADCINLPILKAKTAGVSLTQLQQMPGTDSYAFSLCIESNQKDLILKVCEISKGEEFRDNAEQLIDKFIRLDQNAISIRTLSVKRKVFIGGSVPTNREHIEKLSLKNSTLEGDDLIKHIVKELTINLLDHGFNVSSCPDVSVVGKSVAEGANEWCKTKGKKLTDVYSMQGWFSSDIGLTGESLDMALKHVFIDARKKYLKEHEFFIVIGGNKRAEIECQAARELETVKLLPIGCVGGTALKVSQDSSYNCITTSMNKNEWSQEYIKMILAAMQ